jgi:hypothetical protein
MKQGDGRVSEEPAPQEVAQGEDEGKRGYRGQMVKERKGLKKVH